MLPADYFSVACTRAGTFPLSGVLVLHGGKTLLEHGTKILQSHTYAGSSALAYLTAIEILTEVPRWFNRAAALGRVVRDLAQMILMTPWLGRF